MAWKGHFWGRSLNSRHRARQPGCVWARLSLLKLAMATKHIVPASQGPGQQGRTTSKLFSALGSWPFSLVRKEHQYNKCDFSKDFIYFLERGEGRDKERETLMCERNIDRLPLTCPQLGTWPAAQACALTGNWTVDLFVCRGVLNPLSHNSQGNTIDFKLTGAVLNLVSKSGSTSWSWGCWCCVLLSLVLKLSLYSLRLRPLPGRASGLWDVVIGWGGERSWCDQY